MRMNIKGYQPLKSNFDSTLKKQQYQIKGFKFSKFHLFFILLICFFIYLIEFSTIGNYIQNFEFYNGSHYDLDAVDTKDDYAYFVNTIGCKMPKFPVLDDNIKRFIYDREKIECEIPLTLSDDKYLWMNTNISTENLKKTYNIDSYEDLMCFYQPFRRATDYNNEVYGDLKMLNLYRKTKIVYEFIRVVCDYQNNSKIYRDYHYFVPNKLNIIYNKSNDKNDDNNENNNKYNILIIGLDSLSRLNFQRQMNKSYNLLKHKLQAIEFLGYNKVGDNTYPNLIPALTGFDEKELADTCLPNRKKPKFDNCHFIWKSFSENNYSTAFAEDIASLGLFNYFRNGFIKQPTDFYPRPLFVEMEKHIAKNLKLNIYQCLGGRRPIDIFFGYLKKFLHALKQKPFFSFFWSSSMTHDFFNSGKLIDDDFRNMILEFRKKGFLKNTILFLMSDHGIRWGEYRNTYQGMMEERQPFLFMVLPEIFRKNYPLAMNNLKINEKRLTTHFDLYETLKDLVNTSYITTSALKSRAEDLIDADPIPKGISLFLAIPKTRTCETAGIDSHWCTCHEKHQISKNDIKVQIAARYIVKSINTLLKDYPQCQKLYLMSIQDASLLRTNTNITKSISTKNFFDVTVHLKVKSSLAEFEGTVRLDSNNNVTALTGSISRTNLYGKQSYCVDDYLIKLYCYCGR